jgi:hypothetical protein
MTQQPTIEDPGLAPDPGLTGPGPFEPSHGPDAVQSLRRAMRRARYDDAERVGAQADLRLAQIVRLELLQDALAPLVAQIPKSAETLDIGLMPGSTPRLFVDMIGFIEMGRDARLYRFLQATRHGRLILAESADIPTIVEAVTDYVARRLLERDKALAADELIDEAPRSASSAASPSTAGARPQNLPPSTRGGPLRRFFNFLGIAFAFLIDLLGAITFFTLLAVAGWLAWSHFHTAV